MLRHSYDDCKTNDTYNRLVIDLAIILGQILLRYFVNRAPGPDLQTMS